MHQKEIFYYMSEFPLKETYTLFLIWYFAKKGVRAECIKLNGAVELAPKLKICSTIVDLVSTGKTLSENNLEESNLVMPITSKLIINKIAYKLMNDDITKILNKFKRN